MYTERPGAIQTILVVDDQDAVRGLIRTILSSSGYQVLEASSAAKALSLIESASCSIQLVIADVMLNGISGCELAAQLKAKGTGMPVLFISGHSAEFVAKKCPDVHDEVFLRKPFSPDSLIEKVRGIILSSTPIADRL